MPFSASSCWCRIRHSELMGNCLSLLACWQVATKEWILYVFTVAYKRWSFVNMMLHYGKKSLFWSLNIFGYLSFTTVRGQKNSFQQLWIYKIFEHRKLPCIPCLGKTHIKLQWYNIYSSLFFLFLLCNATFCHSGYVIKPPHPSSTIYGAPPFTGNRFHRTESKWSIN